jgi:hypothetical protein
MEGSRPATPEAPPENLWSSILDSVSSSRSIPSKQVLLLGPPSSGKSVLASALLQKPVYQESKDETRSDFALGYDWADIRDDEGEHVVFMRMKHANATIRYIGTSVGVHGTLRRDVSYGSAATLRTSPCILAPYPCHDCFGLDASLDICG